MGVPPQKPSKEAFLMRSKLQISAFLLAFAACSTAVKPRPSYRFGVSSCGRRERHRCVCHLPGFCSNDVQEDHQRQQLPSQNRGKFLGFPVVLDLV